MSIISEKFNSKITTLRDDFEVNKDIVHQGTKGGLNESELSSIIREVIPQKYIISKGIIENSAGEQSNETDIFIYDDEVLPSYMKSDLTFVPVEAVKYNFEVKSTLNSSDLKTTIGKFEKFRSIGGMSPTVLFSFSSDIKGSELARYKKNDDRFFTNPVVTVLCTSGKSYYFKDVKEYYLKDILKPSEFIKLFSEVSELDVGGAASAFHEFMNNDEVLSQMSRSQFALAIKASIQMGNNMNRLGDKGLNINDVDYNEITFRVHKWIGVEENNNNVDLSFLSGISNTLSKGSFGNYLLHGKDLNIKVFAVCYEDMWGNLSCQDFDEKGLDYNTDKVSFQYSTDKDTTKVIFKRENG